MDSRKKHSPGGKSARKRSGLGIGTLPLIVCAFLLVMGGVLAKYAASNRQRVEMESAQFHISSNYLEEGADASYTVTDWGGGFDILLFNYEKENLAQISGLDMTYTVTVDKGTATVKNESGTPIEANGAGEYSLAVNTVGDAPAIQAHTLHVTPDASVGENDTVTVTVETTAPYRKTLRANFAIRRNSQPDYTVKEQGDGTVLVTVKTNDFSDSMLVEWDPAKFSPDNTNGLMANWKDESPTGSFPVSRDSTYELLFFKNTTDPCGETSGTGTTITLK